MTDEADGGRDPSSTRINALFDPNVFGFHNVGTSYAKPVLAELVARISETKANDVQAVAASQIGLLVGYHQIVLAQSKRSFTWALAGAATGLAFFMAAAGSALWTGSAGVAIIPVISGAVVEVVAGIMFYLYGKTTSQLGDFHSRLETLQRYLLANSMCESLQPETKDKTRAELVREIARIASSEPTTKG